MYSLNLEPPDENEPVIDRSLSSNKCIELFPTIVEICRSKFKMNNPVVIYVGDNLYHVFDLYNPDKYAILSLIKHEN